MTRASTNKDGASAPDPAATAVGYKSDNEFINASEVRARLTQPEPPPKIIGGYRIVGTLGEGGMGVVYEAVQLSLDRTVALKVVRSDLARKDAFVDRFLREAKVAARIDHQNVVTIYDTGEANGHLYMALQYVPGGDVSSRIKTDGRLDEESALRIIAGCAKGLIAIHQAGLVHRDIKPSNIFLATDGTPKIGDLGLARNIIDDEKLTFAGDLVGTPSYMAPEQAKGLSDVDHRADLYSLGTSLYHLLTGRPPFHGSSPFLIGHQVIAEVPPDPRELNRSMSPVVAAVIHHAMQKDRALRYQSAEEFLVDVELVRSGKLPRFARVTVMDQERRASVTGSLAMTDNSEREQRSGAPVGIVIGMLAGIGLATAVALVMARQARPPVEPLPPAPIMPTIVQSEQLPVFPAIQQLPAFTQPEPDTPSAEFLAANEPLDRPTTPTPLLPAAQLPAAQLPAAQLPAAQLPPTQPPAAQPPIKTTHPAHNGAPLVKKVEATNTLAPENTPALPAPEIIIDPEIAPNAGLRVVSETIVRDGSAVPPAPIKKPVVNNLGPTSTAKTQVGQPFKKPTNPIVAIKKPAATTTPPVPPSAPAAPPQKITPPNLVEKPIEDVLKTPVAPEPSAKALPVVNTTPTWASATGSDRNGRWADLTIGTTLLHFRLVPAGTVSIGSPEDEAGRNYNETQHRATIANAYWVSDTECTQIVWRSVMDDNPSSTIGDNLPVDNVSYQRVQAFLTALRAQRQNAPVRLPSEVEWEAACRAGTLGPYTGGLNLRSLAWYRATANSQIAPVARKQPNAYGLFDIHGNVWEWCQDVDRTYPRDPNGNPVLSHAFIYRGGSFADSAADCRAATRNGNQSGDGGVGVGFRLVITADMR